MFAAPAPCARRHAPRSAAGRAGAAPDQPPPRTRLVPGPAPPPPRPAPPRLPPPGPARPAPRFSWDSSSPSPFPQPQPGRPPRPLPGPLNGSPQTLPTASRLLRPYRAPIPPAHSRHRSPPILPARPPAPPPFRTPTHPRSLLGTRRLQGHSPDAPRPLPGPDPTLDPPPNQAQVLPVPRTRAVLSFSPPASALLFARSSSSWDPLPLGAALSPLRPPPQSPPQGPLCGLAPPPPPRWLLHLCCLHPSTGTIRQGAHPSQGPATCAVHVASGGEPSGETGRSRGESSRFAAAPGTLAASPH